jgi:hypothetical protein
MIRLTIDYGWAGCRTEVDLPDIDDSWTEDEIEEYCSEYARDEIFSQVEWNWKKVDED